MPELKEDFNRVTFILKEGVIKNIEIMEESKEITLKILYVGNDISFINQLSEDNRFSVVHKSNGLFAMNWITNNNFDVFKENKEALYFNHYDCPEIDAIICNIYLPGMNAFDFFNEIKRKKIFDGIPFIILTNKFDFQLRNRCIQNGIDDYYTLPVNNQNLYERIIFLKEYKQETKEQRFIVKPSEIKPYKISLLKRTFDILVAGTALLLLSPLMILVAIAIRLESKGKVYYISKRVGANYKTFDFYKFRSMYPDADKRLRELEHLNVYAQNEKIEDECPRCAKLENGKKCSPIVYFDGNEMCEYMAIKKRNARKAFLKIVNDPRITKVGKFIRNTSIDELPQLINILKGDMSIVGNRPLPVNEAEAITKQGWGKRFQAAAGLTGLWQVELRGRGGVMSEEERFKLDNEYAEHNSFWGDIKLIFRTIGVFIQKENV